MTTSGLTRPLFTLSRRRGRIFCFVAVLLLLLLAISPGLYMLSWHLRHGSTIETRGEPVYVPLGWVAEIGSANEAELINIPFFVPLKRVNFAGISVELAFPPHPPQDLGSDYKALETLFWNFHLESETVSGPVRIGSGSREIYCMEGSYSTTDWSEADCLVLRGKWTAHFMGDNRELSKFFAIIQKLN